MIEEFLQGQEHMAQFFLDNRRVWNTSDCGTGKTIAVVKAFHDGLNRGEYPRGSKVVVLCTRTSMQTTWGDDIDEYNASFSTDFTYVVASAKNRPEAFRADVDFIILNHDGVKDLTKNMRVIHEQNYLFLVLDEATAYKNLSQRTKALLNVSPMFEWRTAMSATPDAKSVLDMFLPTLALDDGDHLGKSYYRFRSQICEPVRVGESPNAVRWDDKPGAKDQIVDALVDMTIRYELELNATNEFITLETDIPPKVRRAYEFMRDHGLYEDGGDVVVSANAAVKLNKMLQILTGSIYDNQGKAILVDTERYELVCDKVAERRHPALVIYNWSHELDQLCKHADKKGLRYAYINGNVKDSARTDIVHRFDDEQYDCVFAHSKTVAHSLTFTRGDAVIWASPPNSPELLYQGSRRIYRGEQEKDCQVIFIAARGTKEAQVYQRLQDPLATQAEILKVFAEATQARR